MLSVGKSVVVDRGVRTAAMSARAAHDVGHRACSPGCRSPVGAEDHATLRLPHHDGALRVSRHRRSGCGDPEAARNQGWEQQGALASDHPSRNPSTPQQIPQQLVRGSVPDPCDEERWHTRQDLNLQPSDPKSEEPITKPRQGNDFGASAECPQQKPQHPRRDSMRQRAPEYDLQLIVEEWPALPDAIKAGIVALVKATKA